MELKSYLDFAEDDFTYLKNTIKDGYVANAMGALASNICEKYLKHIIHEFYKPTTTEESSELKELMRAHNLKKITSFLENKLGIKISEELRTKINNVDGYYFSTRYPGDDSVTLSKEDITRCLESIEACRDFTIEFIRERSLPEIDRKGKDLSEDIETEEPNKDNR